MINWATSPHVKRLNMAFVLVDEKRADLSERLTGNPHVASIEVQLPDEAERVSIHQRHRRSGRAQGVLGLRRHATGRADRRYLAHRPERDRAVGARRRAPPRCEGFFASSRSC
jgi:hypothetical protein